MMNLKKILGASALAFALPFAASAATLQIDGDNFNADYFDGSVIPLSVGDGTATVVNTTYFESDADTGAAGFLYTFNITNISAAPAALTVTSGTVNQSSVPTQSFGFYSGADTWLNSIGGAGVAVSFGDQMQMFTAGQTDPSKFEFSTILDLNESIELTFEFGAVECTGANNTGCPDIDFVLSATPVPVPAAGFLLLGGLGGLAMMRRRKKS